MGYYLEWGDYSGVSGNILDRIDRSMSDNSLNIREEIYDKKIRDNLKQNHRKIKAWGMENIKGTWTMAHAEFGGDKFAIVYFELEEDFVGFKLTWM